MNTPFAPDCGLSQSTRSPEPCGSSAVASAALARRVSSGSRPRANSGAGLRTEPVASVVARKSSPCGEEGMAIEQAASCALANTSARRKIARGV